LFSTPYDIHNVHMTRSAEILKTWSIICAVLALTLVVFELGLRQTQWRHLAHSEYHTFPLDYFQPDDVLGGDLRPNSSPGSSSLEVRGIWYSRTI
jgi:hypothetical protein